MISLFSDNSHKPQKTHSNF